MKTKWKGFSTTQVAGKFPIGFWNYPSVNECGPEEVSRWIKCGMTLNQSPRFDYAVDKKEDLLAILDECERFGMKLILCIEGLDYLDALKDLEEYRRSFERAYRDFGTHPATYGFHIGDEPLGEEQNRACIEAYKIQLEIAPELVPFLNFFPIYPNFETDILGGREFTPWAQEFTEQSGCKLICYDCYSQMSPEEDGLDKYFVSLKKYGEMANHTGIELWTTLLSVGHYRYRVPNEDDLRWQLNTAVASGCRGILWFLFYNQIPLNNYRGAPIDEFDEETDTYWNLARVQKRFHAMHGDLLCRLRHQQTWHFEQCFGTVDAFPEDTHPLIRKMESIDGVPGLISLFTDETGKEYWVLVNNSPKEAARFAFVLDKKKVRNIWRIELNGEKVTDFAVSHHDAIYKEKEEIVEAGCWFAPGQMEIFCFE